MYLTEELNEKAERNFDSTLYQYIKTLNKFGVVGFSKQSTFQKVEIFLYEEKAGCADNGKSLIWSSQLSETLKKIFRSK